MGFRISWIARRGLSSAELLATFDCEPTGERHEFPDVGFYLLQLPGVAGGPWSVLIADGSENFAELTPSHAQALSAGTETLSFWCSDTTMSTEMLCHRDQGRIWSIEYDCEDESKRPAIGGEIPAVAHDLLARLQEQQRASDEAGDDVDHIYDLTSALGRALVGFRHDGDAETDEPEPYQVLSRATIPETVAQPRSDERPWWKFWAKKPGPRSVEARLEHALQQLLARTNDDAFVIVEDVTTEKYVQFGAGESLILDLPLVALKGQEQQRASLAFARLGVSQPEEYDKDFFVLRCDFGRDCQRAAKEALRVFADVYQLPNPRFNLREN